MLGFAKYVNASRPTTNKCLAGRKLVVDFYDSALNPNKIRDGEMEACTNDVAMVGTAAVFLTTVDEMRSCHDQAGVTTGIPDVPGVSPQLAEDCSDESFPITPPTVRCNTQTQHPQTYEANIARGYYFTKQFGNLHGIYIFPDETQISTRRHVRDAWAPSATSAAERASSSDRDFDLLANVPQSAYTPVVQAMKDHSSPTTPSAPRSTSAPWPCAERRPSKASPTR